MIFRASYYHDFRLRVIAEIPTDHVHDVRGIFSGVINGCGNHLRALEVDMPDIAARSKARAIESIAKINKIKHKQEKVSFGSFFREDANEQPTEP